MASSWDKILCPECNAIPEFTHRNGTNICRCPNRACKNHWPWKTKDQWDDILEESSDE